MAFDSNVKQFKEFLLLYNYISESCFNKCITNLHGRSCDTNEFTCIDRCIRKHVNINHKMMSVYAELQPIYMERRMEELMKQSQPPEGEQEQAVQ